MLLSELFGGFAAYLYTAEIFSEISGGFAAYLLSGGYAAYQ